MCVCMCACERYSKSGTNNKKVTDDEQKYHAGKKYFVKLIYIRLKYTYILKKYISFIIYGTL